MCVFSLFRSPCRIIPKPCQKVSSRTQTWPIWKTIICLFPSKPDFFIQSFVLISLIPCGRGSVKSDTVCHRDYFKTRGADPKCAILEEETINIWNTWLVNTWVKREVLTDNTIPFPCLTILNLSLWSKFSFNKFGPLSASKPYSSKQYLAPERSRSPPLTEYHISPFKSAILQVGT